MEASRRSHEGLSPWPHYFKNLIISYHFELFDFFWWASYSLYLYYRSVLRGLQVIYFTNKFAYFRAQKIIIIHWTESKRPADVKLVSRRRCAFDATWKCNILAKQYRSNWETLRIAPFKVQVFKNCLFILSVKYSWKESFCVSSSLCGLAIVASNMGNWAKLKRKDMEINLQCTYLQSSI